MAFFNLTQLGPQNLFKTANTCRGDSPATPAPRPQASPEPEAAKVGAGTSIAQTGSDEQGSNPTLQRESTGNVVRVTASGTAPSTSKYQRVHQKSDKSRMLWVSYYCGLFMKVLMLYRS